MRFPTSPSRNRIAPAPALALALCAGSAFTAVTAAAPHEAHAQARNGPLTVLGLRAPDGEDEIAASATSAVRRAARAAQYDVPDTAPALEQAMALAGCDETPEPNCLNQMATELNAQRIVYGSVRRAGARGGPLRIELFIFERASRNLSGPATASDVPRAIAMDDRALDGPARRLVDEVLAASARSRTPTPPTGGPLPPPGPGPGLPPDEGPTHGTVQPGVPIRRYIGFGAIGLGGVFMVIGAVEGFLWLSFSAEQQQPGSAWVQYQPFSPDDPRTRDTGEVCSAARRGAENTYGTGSIAILQPDVVRVCNTHSTMQGAQWGFLTAGAVIAAAGVVLAVTDRTGREARPAGATGSGGATSRLRSVVSQIAFAPVLTPSVQGITAGLRF